MKNTLFKTGLLLISMILFLSPFIFAEDPIYTGFLSSKAVSGYDPVAYFTDGKPVEGKSEYTTEYKGADWYFSSLQNLLAFKNNPEKYAPRYGGYCAWAVAQGSTAKGDPKYWAIVNGRLYLNYNQEIQDKWLRDKDNLITKADKNWPAVIK